MYTYFLLSPTYLPVSSCSPSCSFASSIPPSSLPPPFFLANFLPWSTKPVIAPIAPPTTNSAIFRFNLFITGDTADVVAAKSEAFVGVLVVVVVQLLLQHQLLPVVLVVVLVAAADEGAAVEGEEDGKEVEEEVE